jgi:hypothetical protein
MIDMAISKGQLHKQLWPLVFDGTLVFSFELMGEPGIFGIKDNYLNFIPMGNLADTINISIPENTEEVMGFLASADFIINRLMMTPQIIVENFPEPDGVTPNVLRKEVMKTLLKFTDTRNKHLNEFERLKNDWA